MRTRIKICGICRPEDAELAASLGADAIGIVRAEGAGRYVDRNLAVEIIRALPPFVTPVLLQVNAVAHQLAADMSAMPRPVMLQFNGDESPNLISGTQIIKAIRVDDKLPAKLAAWKSVAAAIVLESPGQTGGSGIANDWSAVLAHVRAGLFADAPPLILAGGLTPATVGDLVRAIRPFAVDVSSGVELIKRQKDAGLMREFVEAVRSADASIGR